MYNLYSLFYLLDCNYDDLEIENEIGRGAFGKVYKAMYFGTEVAVKKIANNINDKNIDVDKFLKREVALLKGMRHPGIVSFIGVANHTDGIYIVTEYVSKGNLRSVLKNEPTLGWKYRIKLAHDIACAMAYLHSRNIIFRDLKSKNVQVDEHLRAKLCDFGFARRIDSKRAQAFTLCGTDDWMAPEVILGMEYDEKADIFSYGIVLFEIITRLNVTKFLQRNPQEAFALNLDKTRSFVPKQCPSEFVDLAVDCCTYEPNDRPNFKRLAQILGDLVKNEPDGPTTIDIESPFTDTNSNSEQTQQSEHEEEKPVKIDPRSPFAAPHAEIDVHSISKASSSKQHPKDFDNRPLSNQLTMKRVINNTAWSPLLPLLEDYPKRHGIIVTTSHSVRDNVDVQRRNGKPMPVIAALDKPTDAFPTSERKLSSVKQPSVVMGKRNNTIESPSFPTVAHTEQSYDKTRNIELSIKKGDLLLIYDILEGSYYGEIIESGIPNAKLGWFPVSHVRLDVLEEVEPYIKRKNISESSKYKKT